MRNSHQKWKRSKDQRKRHTGSGLYKVQFVGDLWIDAYLGQQKGGSPHLKGGNKGSYATLDKGGLWPTRMYLAFLKTD